MMFKDIYKAANDDIKPDPYLLTRIINKSKEERPVSFFYRHRAAVAAAVIALVIALPSVFKGTGTPQETAVLDANPVSDTTISGSTFIMPEPTTPAIDTPTEKATATVQSSDIVPAENAVNDASPAKPPEAVPPAVFMTVNSVSPTASAAGGMRYSVDGGSFYENTQTITIGQYFTFAGIDPDKLVIPSGISPDFNIDDEVTVTNVDGKISTGLQSFYYSGDKSLIISFSDSTSQAEQYLNDSQYEKSLFGDTPATVLSDGSIYEAHMILESGIALKITTDMTEEDLKNLLISAAN